MKDLTDKQTKILTLMIEFFRDNQRFPTQLEMAGHFGVLQNSIVGQLHSMIKKGVLSSEKGKARSFKVVGYKAELVPMENN